jgi:hypothetical protein
MLLTQAALHDVDIDRCIGSMLVRAHQMFNLCGLDTRFPDQAAFNFFGRLLSRSVDIRPKSECAVIYCHTCHTLSHMSDD